MTPLHRDPQFAFRFADARVVPRFHLDGVEPGRRVTVFRATDDGTRTGLLAKATVGDGGWVDLPEPVRVQPGDGFVAVPAPDVAVRPEVEADRHAVFHVNRAAFGQDAEARLVDLLREGGFARASLVAEVGGRVVGHVLFSDLPIRTAGGTAAAVALAPMAVLPEFQHLGVGSVLVERGLAACRELGHRIAVVLGHPHFYPRFGFSAGLAKPLESPFAGDAFMAAELVPGALGGVAGRVEYAPPFAAFG